MAFNKSSINNNAVNASDVAPGFVSQIGGGIVVSISQAVKSLGTGIVVSIAQNVGALATQTLVASIQQVVEFKSTSTAGAVVSIAQAVKSLGSKTVDVEQTVIALVDPTSFYSRNGYEPRIYLDGVLVPSDELHGDIECTFKEEGAPQLTFSMIPPTGVQDIRKYVGNSVVYNIMKNEGGTPVITRMFTGKVNTPSVDILTQKISFSCSIDIEQQAESLTRSYLNSVGYYSNKLFSKPETQLEELKDRVSTVPELINVTPYGVVDTKAISTATTTKTYDDADVYRRDINFILGSRQRYINKINIKMKYSYQRLHHHERGYSLAGSGTFCETTTNFRNTLLRSLVEGAVQGSSWVLRYDGITYLPIWPAGWYGCADVGPAPLQAWNGGVTCTTQVVPVLDGNGTQVTIDGVDQKEAINGCVDSSKTFCTGASWTAATRFSQNVVNEFTLSIQAPQSIAQNGEKVKTRNYVVTDSFDSASWEDYKDYNDPIPANTLPIVSGSSYYIEATQDFSEYIAASNIAMNVAKNEILKSHREDTVEFTRAITPGISLKDVVALTADKLATVAAVKGYRHTIKVGSGEAYTKVELALSQSDGAATDSTLTAPALISNTPSYDSGVITLGGYFGVDPNSTHYAGIGGYYTDQVIRGSIAKTSFGTQVRVTTPEIPGAIRVKAELTSTTSFDVEIPDDTLTINFDQWT